MSKKCPETSEFFGHANYTLFWKGRTPKMATEKTIFLYIWNTYEADTTKKMVFHAIQAFLRFCTFKENIILLDLKGRYSYPSVAPSPTIANTPEWTLLSLKSFTKAKNDPKKKSETGVKLLCIIPSALLCITFF